MSAKRDFADHPCEAEDLSMSSKKRVKKAPQRRGKVNDSMELSEDEDGLQPQETAVKSLPLTEIMDIQEPMSKLRSLLENRLGVELRSFTITLQDKVEMELEDCLGDQCIQSDGLAEIKVELKQQHGINRINIIDVLKHTQEDRQDEEDGGDVEEEEEVSSVEDLTIKTGEGQGDDRSDVSSSTSDSRSSPTPYSWTILHDVSSLFPIPLPSDTLSWTETQVQHWLKWAMEEFKVKFVDDSMWNITGNQLSQMTAEEFQKKVPLDPHNMLWTHIELLRKCQIFAVVDKLGQRSSTSLTKVKPSQNSVRKPRTASSSSTGGINGRRMSLTGNNGQIQLWQFLLELLGDKKSKSVIQWVGRDGEFKLNDPELVAQLWGQRKNKPKMNYEKLSRALRYYYSEAMIAKVHGRRFVYKFVCNLKELVGYTTQELISLVEDEPIDFVPLT